MSFTILLDVVIGLTLTYLGASLYITIINEFIGQVWNLRAKQLSKNLKELIDSDDAVSILKSNPALAPFFDDNRSSSSYIDTKMVAEQLIGGLRKGANSVATLNEIIESINAMSDSKLKTQLLALTQVGADSVENFVKSTSTWIDQSLTMMGEIYKKHMQLISFGIGLTIAIALNLNTVSLASHLYRDADARNSVVALAEGFVQDVDKEKFAMCSNLSSSAMKDKADCAGLVSLIDGLRQRNETFGKLPIGWSQRPPGESGLYLYGTTIIGWLLTALAISLGAPFWFDLLSRLVNVRHAMRKPQPVVEHKKNTQD